MFGSYNTTSEYFLSDYVAIAMAILRRDNNLIFLHVKISYFYMRKYMDFLSGRNPNKTLVFI